MTISLDLNYITKKNLTDRLLEISDLQHPDYAQYLSRDTVHEKYSTISPQDLSGVKSWLEQSHGVKNTYLNSHYLHFQCNKILHHTDVPEHLKNNVLLFPFFETGYFINDKVSGKMGKQFKRIRKPMNETQLLGSGSPNKQRQAYGIPDSAVGHESSDNFQMVWGPGTFGISKDDLEIFYNYYCNSCKLSDVTYDTKNHGQSQGDNYIEGTLDTELISSMGRGINTVVSNTNTSQTNEEGENFGYAFLNFLVNLNNRTAVPNVLSLSLGSLSFHACDKLCKEQRSSPYDVCWTYLQKQRQVCMFANANVEVLINLELQKLGLRGVTVLAASGDGGSHYSFQKYSGGDPFLAAALNKVSCENQLPTFPSSSPFLLSVGGSDWDPDSGASADNPVGWNRGGCGFSWVYPALTFQQATQETYLNTARGLPPDSSFNQTGRGYPDISGLATGVPICDYGGCSEAGGTSASAPEVAGVFSLINEHRRQNGLPSLGFVNPRLYYLAKDHASEMFRDLTEGKSNFQCDSGFPATNGWDSFTGFGEPNWPGLIKYLGDE